MGAQARRGLFTVVAVVAVCVAIGLYIALYLLNVPGSVAATTTATGSHLYLATVPAAELSDPHNTWVSYYAVDASSGNWRHDTTFVLPANTLVHVTIYQYDTSTGLRNPFFSQPAGTAGPVLIDGKPTSVVNPMAPAHTFAIPQIGLSIRSRALTATPRTSAATRRAR